MFFSNTVLSKSILFFFAITLLFSCKESIPKEEIPSFVMNFKNISESKAGAYARERNSGGLIPASTEYEYSGNIAFNKDFVTVTFDGANDVDKSKVNKVHKNSNGYSFHTEKGEYKYSYIDTNGGKIETVYYIIIGSGLITFSSF